MAPRTVFLLALCALLGAAAARAVLPTAARQRADCAKCTHNWECESNFCTSGKFCAKSTNYVDIFGGGCDLKKLVGSGGSSGGGGGAGGGAGNSGGHVEAFATAQGSGGGKGSGFSASVGTTKTATATAGTAAAPAFNSPCPACKSGSDCTPREPNLRCVGGRCVKSLLKKDVEECHGGPIFVGSGSTPNCNYCDASAECSGVCINHKCFAAATYDALLAC